MLTWINEKAKWIIVIFAVGIVLGLLAMDRIPDQAIQYPIGKVDGEKISYENFDSRLKMIIANRYEGVHLEEEQYSKLRQDLFQSFVRQHLLTKVMNDVDLNASVAEMKAEISRNPDLIRSMVGQEAQQRIYAIQSTATSAEDANQRMQAYIATLPQFLLDSTFDKASFDQWLNTPEAYEWQAMMNYENDLKTSSIPLKQLQIFIAANLHPTSLESHYNVERRLTDYDLEIAVVDGSDFAAPESSVDSVVVSAYFSAFDSFYVEKDLMKLKYAVLPIEATAADEAKIREYAMTLYFQLTDSTSTTNFEELARITSEDPASAEQGGLLGDYTARGAWVKEFEDVAFALDSGAISEPVRTKYGFHIIQSHGKKVDSTGAELVKVSHILLAVTASSETIDSLERIMEDVKVAFESSENFDAAAKTKNLPVLTSEWLSKGNQIPSLGYVPGLTAYSFANKERPEASSGPISSVLKNKNFVVIASKTDSLVAGTRSLNAFYNDIKSKLLQKKSAENAAAYLNSVAEKIKEQSVAKVDSTAKDSLAQDSASATMPVIEKVKMEKAVASVDGFVPGVGYSHPMLSSILKNQKVGEWGPVITTDRGAIMLKINSIKQPSEDAVEAAIKEELENAFRFDASVAFNNFVTSLEVGAKVDDNLDLYYKD